MEVKRYVPVNLSHGFVRNGERVRSYMIEVSNGPYVRWEDYERLRVEHEIVKRRVQDASREG
jgi:hypothetical protein